MYKCYLVPDATQFSSHTDIYAPENMKLFWDPYAESDVYSCTEPQWKEELNKALSFQFTVLPSNICYDQFFKRKSVVIVFDDDEWLFEGVVTEAPVDFYKQRKVTVTGALSYFCDSVQAPDEKNVTDVPSASATARYFHVPDSWHAGANPKGLNWFEQKISSTYTAVEQTDIYRPGTTYYRLSSGQYTEYYVTEGSWNSRPQLYIASGQQLGYVQTNDTEVNAAKVYYYESTGDGRNYIGVTFNSKAATNESIIDHIKRLLNVHNAQVDPFKRIKLGTMYNSRDTAQHEFKSSGFRNTWDALKSDILDQFGKYFTITRGSDNHLYLNYLELNQLPASTGSLLEVANNVLELNEPDDGDDDLFTVLVPTGKDNLTVEGVTGHNSPSSNTAEVSPYIASFGGNRRYVVVSPAAIRRYGYIFKPNSFSDVEKADELYNRAVQYIQNNYNYRKSYEVKAIDLHFIQGAGKRIRIGDRVRIHSVWHGIDTSELYVITAEHDMANPENDTYKIGIPTSDYEANKKTLSRQSRKSGSSASSYAAGSQAAIESLMSKLEALMEVDDWGIHAHTNIENRVESANMMYYTHFLQTETDLNLIAQKVFGPELPMDEYQDAGYIKVPISDYKQPNGSYRNPYDELWYEYTYDEESHKYMYERSMKSTCDPAVWPDVDFYVQRLWTRYSNVDVGPDGIKGRVDGNYMRSTANSSWIKSNEDSIIALTGHLYVDNYGHIHTTAGAGMRTDHNEERTVPTYYPVSEAMMVNADPKSKDWYELEVDGSGAWIGLNAPDAFTNDAYYRKTNDTTVNRSKHYYYKSFVRESFSSQFGVYDEDNLTAGILVRTINNPTYKVVPLDERKRAQKAKENPQNKGWYEYDHQTGLYGITLDTQVLGNGDDMKEYFTVDNQMQSYSNVMGDHVVIGGRLDQNGNPIIYGGVDDATKARINKYISGKSLDGTVTEIASDVLYAKAVFTNYLNVYAKKLIGDDADDDNFVAVTPTSGANPSAEGWYERNASTGTYFLTADSEIGSNKTYYMTKLMTRITSLDAGEGGFRSTILGNYNRSVASAAWIEANEEKLNMLLGHVGEDENGNLVIDAGAGLRVGYSEPGQTAGFKYVLVKKSEYAGTDPSEYGWLEPVITSDGKWPGAGKADWSTNSAYYRTTSDHTADYTKQYYKLSNMAEMFYAEYGVYDQGNLTAGVVAQMVNNPLYLPIVKAIQQDNVNPSKATSVVIPDGSVVQSQWYTYDSASGRYGRAVDKRIQNDVTYYYLVNSTGTYTNIRGDHIIIGPATTPTSMDDDARRDETLNSRISRYVGDHHLNGTITEIASDVVRVNALFARYIEAEELTAETGSVENLWADTFHARSLVQSQGDMYIFVGGKYSPSGFAVSEGIKAFGAPSYNGDDVTIPYWTLGQYPGPIQGSSSYAGSITFTKPASLGTVTWSSGEKLTVKTAGGKTFFEADLNIPKVYYGVSVSYAMDNNGDIAPMTLLRNKPILSATMDVSGTWTNESHDESEDDPIVWTGTIYFDGSKAYDAGRDRGKDDVKIGAVLSNPVSQTPGGDEELWEHIVASASTTLYNTYYRYTVSYDGTTFGDPKYFKTPSKGELQTFASKGGTNFTSGDIELDYADDVTVYGQRKMDGETEWTDATNGIRVKSPSKGSYQTYAEYDSDGDGDAEGHTSGSIDLGYSDGVTVYGQRKMDGESTWSYAPGITVTSPADRYDTGKTDGANTLSISPSSNVSLGYGEPTTVSATTIKGDGSEKTLSVTLTSPSKGELQTYAEYDSDGDGDAEGHTSGSIDLGYSDNVTVYGLRKMDGESTWSYATGIQVKSPSKGELQTFASKGGNNYTSGDITLGYSDDVIVYGQRKMDGESVWTNAAGIRVKSPSKGSYQTFASKGGTNFTSGTISLGYSDEVTVYGQRKMDGETIWSSATGIKITSPPDNSSSMTLNTDDIQLGGEAYKASDPGGTKLNTLKSNIMSVINTSWAEKWVKFTITVTHDGQILASKTYKMNFAD